MFFLFVGKSMSQLLSRCVAIEINKNHENMIEYLKSLNYKYIIIGGYEIGEKSSENLHFHCFIDFGKRIKLKNIQKQIKGNGDFRICNFGDSESCREYCIKLEKDGFKVKEKFDNNQIIFEDGEFEKLSFGQGQRNDILKKIEENPNLDDFMKNEIETYIKYKNGIRDIYKLKNRESTLRTRLKYMKGEMGLKIEYHTGNSRCGKTYTAAEILEKYMDLGLEIAIIDFDEAGFAMIDGSENAEIVLLNEYRDSVLKLSDFLKLTTNEGRIRIKGGDFLFKNMKRLIITSIIKPEDLYKNVKNESKIQIKERITEIYEHSKINGKYINEKREWQESTDDIII